MAYTAQQVVSAFERAGVSLLRLPRDRTCTDRAFSLNAPKGVFPLIALACALYGSRLRAFAPTAVFVARPSKVVVHGGWYVVSVDKRWESVLTHQSGLVAARARASAIPPVLDHGNVRVTLVGWPDRPAVRRAFHNLP